MPRRPAVSAVGVLETLPRATLENHQPYWAARAQFLADLGRSAEARTTYTRAIGLSEDHAVRAFLTARAAALPVGKGEG